MWGGLLFSLAFPCLTGYLLLSALSEGREFGFLVTVAVSFGLGMGLLTQGMLLLDVLGVPYSASTIIWTQVIMALVILGFLVYKMRGRRLLLGLIAPVLRTKGHIFGGCNAAERFVLICSLAFLGYYVIYVFWAALNIPVYSWDSFATCVYNAKVIYFEGSLTDLKQLAHRTYPLHVPMILSWIAFNLGHWDDQLMKIVFPLIFIFFVIIYHFFMGQYTTRKGALVGVIFLFSSNLLMFQATVAYRDIFLSYYVCSAVMFLVIWQDRRKDSYLILAALFTGFATFTKLEGLAYLAWAVILLVYILARCRKTGLKEKAGIFLRFFVPCFIIFFFFFVYKISKGTPVSEYIEFDLSDAWRRWPQVTKNFFRALFLTANWNIIWVLFILSVIRRFSSVKGDRRIQVLLLALFMGLGIHYSVALVSAQSGHIITPYTISRLILQVLPIATILIVLINCPAAEGRSDPCGA